jgi:DHA2 family multidrug resistance protein-like MFS transporter
MLAASKRAADEPLRLRQRMAVAAVLSAMAAVVLDASMMTIAVPSLAGSLEIAPAHALRIVTGYQAAVVMGLLPCAALGESFGCRRLFAVGLLLFACGAFGGTLAPSLPWLLATRFVQGVGGAAIMALGIALLRETLPPHRLGHAIGWNALAVALCSAAGPVAGALLLDVAGWRSLFAIGLSLALIALAAARALPASSGTGRQIDLAAGILGASGFGLLVVAAECASARPRFALLIVGTATLCFLLMIRRERGKLAPILPADLLASSGFRRSVLASICCFAGQAGGMLALSFHLQGQLGLSASAAAVCLTSWPLAVAISASLSARLAARVPTAWLCAGGGAMLASGLMATALIPAEAGSVPIAICAAVCGIGFGLFQVPNNRTLFLSAPPERAPAAGGMQGTARLAGQTTGALLVSFALSVFPVEAAPQLAIGLAAIAALTAAALSWRSEGAGMVSKLPRLAP